MASALMVTTSFLPGRGGIESYLAALCTELCPHLAVLAPGRRGGAPLPQGLGYPAFGYPGSMLAPSRRVLRAIEESASRCTTERVLFGTPWPLAVLGPELKERGLRYALIAHGAEVAVPAALPVARGRLLRALAGADLLLAASRYTRERLRESLTKAGLPVPETALLRARVDLERWSPEAATQGVKERFGIQPHHKVVLVFGRLVRRKGVHRLLRAISRVAEQVPEAMLVVAGTGPEEKKLRKMAREERAPVMFTGQVTDVDAPALYAAADVFALAVADRWFGLEFEGLGVVLLEASACGTPCVTGTSGGTPEAVIHGKTGLVVDAREEAALAGNIAWLLNNPKTAAAMGRAGRRHVHDQFSGGQSPRALVDWLGLKKASSGKPAPVGWEARTRRS